MQTGEDERALRKILDMTRLMAITILLIHFYFFCYQAFRQWQLTNSFVDQLMGNIGRTGLLKSFHLSKTWSLGLLAVSLVGIRGRKDEQANFKTACCYILTGLALYYASILCLYTDLLARSAYFTRATVY